MTRLGSPDLNDTFKNNSLGATTGTPAQEITVEVLGADPTLEAGVPRIWINTATGTLKFTADGATTKVVTAT